ncbi:hypothetical protein MKW98_001443 [Papaver atlanticum]|uniref:beta-ketoacyl-[acyl-carrier-protein] synthase I n=1 Tax=Papaver atlanticum TaxID=357466 RepID=A0AAD4XK44_9MAGN|nr:hypothetical protein MKW98_001443 [Papaver atlanticum]
MNPFCVPFATTSMGSAMLTIDLGCMGSNYSISTTCATSNILILNATNHIIRGEAEVLWHVEHFQKAKRIQPKLHALGILYSPMIFCLL